MTTTVSTVLITSKVTSTLKATQTNILQGYLVKEGQISTISTTTSTFSASAANTGSSTVALVTNSATSMASNSVFSNLLSGTSSSSAKSNPAVAVAVDIPLGILGGIVLAIVVWYFIKTKKYTHDKNATDAFAANYDTNFNYKQPISPYHNVRAMYQVKLSRPPNQNQNEMHISRAPNESAISLSQQHADPNWGYESPLSKWFLDKAQAIDSAVYGSTTNNLCNPEKREISTTGSLSTGEFNCNNPVPKTPKTPIATTLKEFKLKVKKTLNSAKSPFFPRQPEAVYQKPETFDCSVDSGFSSNASTKNTVSKSNEKISQQVINVTNKDYVVPKLQPILKFETETSMEKPLPHRPFSKVTHNNTVNNQSISENSFDIDEKVYKVVKNYNRNLTDELTIRIGEFYKILAKHTDGWCLVEKCDTAGNPVIDSSYNSNINYINDSRGIVPSICLATY